MNPIEQAVEYEWGVVLRAYPETIHRTMPSEAIARQWLGTGDDAAPWAIVRRAVAKWEIVDV